MSKTMTFEIIIKKNLDVLFKNKILTNKYLFKSNYEKVFT